MEALLSVSAETGDFADFRYDVAELALLNCLLDGFGGVIAPEEDRASIFLSYVDAHFDEPLSLAQVARHFNLSTEHFAKVFKTKVGTTFHAYLTDARLEAATEQLCSTDDTVTRVALESGFPNVAAFNQAFKDRYGTTPKRYRTTHARSTSPTPSVATAEETALLTVHPIAPSHDGWDVVIDARARREVLHASWREVIGLGTVESLSDSRVREQALWLKGHLSFERWRVGCDFAQYEGERGLYDLGNCFDFIVGNGFVPHVLVEYAPGTDAQAYSAAFNSALRRFANRYSVQTIRTWRFELIVRGGTPHDVWSPYLELFSRICDTLDAYGHTAGLMGPGMRCDQKCDNLQAFLRAAKRRHARLSAITIACRPAAPATDNGKELLVRTGDRYYLRNQVLMARETLEREGFDPDLLVVGGWRDSLETSNIMNDSCYEAASIMQTALSTLGLVRSLCYNDALDLSVDAGGPAAFLSGRSGIVNRDGIPKPSYYAFDFLAHVGRGLVFCDEHCVASANEAGNYQIVCHNCERLNAAYLTTPEGQLDYQHMSSYFDEPAERVMRFELRNVRVGTYLVKTRFVNEDGGSVGDEAKRMQMWNIDEPSRAEVDHLKAYAQPQLVLERHVVTDGTLSFERVLKSNEIAYLHVIYLY
jgi:AraC-like DNA-binding protein/beta-xylosidase